MTAVDLALLDCDALLSHMFANSARRLWQAVRAGELDLDDLEAFLAAERVRVDAWWQIERAKLRDQLLAALRDAGSPETDDGQPLADTPIATVH